MWWRISYFLSFMILIFQNSQFIYLRLSSVILVKHFSVHTSVTASFNTKFFAIWIIFHFFISLADNVYFLFLTVPFSMRGESLLASEHSVWEDQWYLQLLNVERWLIFWGKNITATLMWGPIRDIVQIIMIVLFVNFDWSFRLCAKFFS